MKSSSCTTRRAGQKAHGRVTASSERADWGEGPEGVCPGSTRTAPPGSFSEGERDPQHGGLRAPRKRCFGSGLPGRPSHHVRVPGEGAPRPPAAPGSPPLARRHFGHEDTFPPLATLMTPPRLTPAKRHRTWGPSA